MSGEKDRVELEIAAPHDGKTVAATVREVMGNIPWNRAKDLCHAGKVTIDGVTTRDPAARVRAGQRLCVSPTAPRLSRGSLAREDIAYVDAEVVVVRKPAGLLTVPFDEGDKDTLVDRAHASLRPRQRASLGVVQRLDKDTTGLVVFARTLAAKRELQQQFRKHSVGRRYLAIAHGHPSAITPDATLTFDTMLMRDRGDGLRGSWGVWARHRGRTPPTDTRQAITHVTLRESLVGASLLECRLETGRQHQIRIHLAEAGHPLVGERVYIRDYAEARIDAPRPMLHATHLAFDHPRTGERVAFDEPLPADFEAMLARLRR